MNTPLQLPARFNGQVGLVLFYQQHGVMLLRSGDGDDADRAVVWMSIPSWFRRFRDRAVAHRRGDDHLPPSHRGKAQSRKLYRVEIDRTPH